MPYNIQVCHRYTCDAKINFLANVNSYTIECTYRYYETMSALYFVHYNICLSTYSPVLKKMQQIIRIICTGTGCTLNIVQTLLLNVTKCFVPSIWYWFTLFFMKHVIFRNYWTTLCLYIHISLACIKKILYKLRLSFVNPFQFTQRIPCLDWCV